MKAVILAGGFGKRLKPLTDSTPKPLVKVGGKPILVMQLEWLRSHGINNVVLCIGFLKEKVMEFIGNGEQFNMSVDYSLEEGPLGTGGALLNAKRFLNMDEAFFVLNGDVITDMDPLRVKNNLNGKIGSLALVPLRSTYGIIELSDEGMIGQFREKPLIQGHWMNAGVYCFSPEIFRYLTNRGNIESTAFPVLAEKGSLKGVKCADCFWKSIDGWKDIEETEKALKERHLSYESTSI